MKVMRIALLIGLVGNCFGFGASWRLDELGSASAPFVVQDSKGSAHGTAFNVTTTGNGGGKVCSAFDLTLDSTLDYVVLGEEAIDGAGDFTISVWLKNTSQKSRSLLSGARVGEGNALLMWFFSPTNFGGYIDNSGVGIRINDFDLSDGNWHHFVWRRQGNQSCVFVNTLLQGCRTVTTVPVRVESLVLGQEQDAVGGRFDRNQDWEGLVDELLIFKQALTSAEIAQIYTNQNSGRNYDGSNRVCKTTAPPSAGSRDYSDFHFDELGYSGATGEVKDSHWGKHATPVNVTVTEGKICNGLDLSVDSRSDYVVLDPSILDGASAFTIALWHKAPPSSDNNSLLSGANTSQFNELIYWFGSATSFRGHIAGLQRSITTPSISDGTWHHLVWRYAGMESCFYLDGIKRGCSYYSTPHALSIGSLILGQEQDSFGGGFDRNQDWEGVIDELLIFRRALSDSEIASIYTNQNSGRNWDGSVRTCPYPKISKSSCVVSDPIRGTTNPMRIPGATIRYAVEVQNISPQTLQQVRVNDTLSDVFDFGTIRNLQIKAGACDCLGVSSASNNPPPGTGEGEHPIVLNFATVAGGSVASPAKKCGYFEVDIK